MFGVATDLRKIRHVGLLNFWIYTPLFLQLLRGPYASGGGARGRPPWAADRG